jgi:hypothetical protein
MEAKREKIVELLHVETPIPDIMSQLRTSRRTIFREKKVFGGKRTCETKARIRKKADCRLKQADKHN